MKEKSSKILNVVIVGLGVLAVVGGIFLFVKNKKQVSLDEVSDKTEVRVDASLATQPLMDAYVDNLTNFNLSNFKNILNSYKNYYYY